MPPRDEVPVYNRPDRGTLTVGEHANSVSGTPKRLTPGQDIKKVLIRFSDRGSAVANELRVVFGATDDTDADTKLAAAGSRRLIELGGEATWSFRPESGIQRIDMASDVATETGSSKIYYEYQVDD